MQTPIIIQDLSASSRCYSSGALRSDDPATISVCLSYRCDLPLCLSTNYPY